MPETQFAEITARGLTAAEAAARLAREGPNTLPERKSPGPLLIFIGQFKSPFIYVLLVAAVISWGLGQQINSLFIMAVLLINALIGTVQEYSAARAAAALRKMVPYRATVIRAGLCRFQVAGRRGGHDGSGT